MEPIFLQSVCKDYLWGGNRLRNLFDKQSDADKIAESWELACHKDGSSKISGGTYDGKSLQDYFAQVGTGVLGTDCAKDSTMPILIKLIDAKQDLSIQVHPKDEYAWRVEGEPGKTEMWYILDCEPGAALYYGVKKTVTKTEFVQHIENQTLPEILNRVEVKPGMLYFIPAGTLHAIGAGILLAEIQQNSNTTYRVYDYGRRGSDGKLRPLHIKKALDTATLTPIAPTEQYAPQPIPGGTVRKLAHCPYFSTDVVTVQNTITASVDTKSFQHLLLLDGSAVLSAHNQTYPLQKGTSVFLPAGFGRYCVQGACQYLITWK